MTRVLAILGLAAMGVAAYGSAHAQLGNMNNPPPQHLFDTGPSQRLDNGLGSMASRRAQLARIKRPHRATHR